MQNTRPEARAAAHPADATATTVAEIERQINYTEMRLALAEHQLLEAQRELQQYVARMGGQVLPVRPTTQWAHTVVRNEALRGLVQQLAQGVQA